ncbi:MAG TPA: DUF1552 domain-containing protein [Fimbriiglobus sp.]|jgi:hypothetical protein
MNHQTDPTPTPPFASTRRPISRRRFLRGAGVALALPLLESMRAPFARAADGPVPRRLFCVCNNLGLLPGQFFPKDAGRDYTPSPYLKRLQDHRADFTVMSGVSHPGVDGGHPSDIAFLTCAPHPASSSFRNTISLDQFVAEKIGTLSHAVRGDHQRGAPRRARRRRSNHRLRQGRDRQAHAGLHGQG